MTSATSTQGLSQSQPLNLVLLPPIRNPGSSQS